MFTGLVQEVGSVVRVESVEGGVRLTVRAPATARAVGVGGSVAVDGVCLTALEAGGDEELVAEVSPETLACSNMAGYEVGTEVNLETPLRAGDPLGGHFVQGHVDAVTRQVSRLPDGEFVRVEYEVPAALSRFLVDKGSVAVNGVSLTVAALRGETFEVQLVPHTLERTNLASEHRAATMNVEVDILGKYVARLLSDREGVAIDVAAPVPTAAATRGDGR